MRKYLHWIGIGVLVAILPLGADSPAPRSLNTSNPYKLAEYRDLLSEHGGVDATHLDIHEIDAEPFDVVVHKASQVGEGVLVDDTSLEVDGRDIGVKIRWLQHLLSSCVGQRAIWRVLIAEQREGLVYVYEGCVKGTIVKPRGEGGYAFDSYLLPDGANKTLAEDRPQKFSARAAAVSKLLDGKPDKIVPVIKEWTGRWQPETMLVAQ